ncbi:MAG: tail fiber protein [Rhodospirillales bacterium]|nr:tail fiber protein [Rhodospirillales bacterium]
MPWPVDDLSTAGVNSGTDRPPRAEFFKLIERVRTIIQGRSMPEGVAGLDSRGRLFDTAMGRGVPHGVASLDGNGRVPSAQLPPPPTVTVVVPAGTISIYAGLLTPSGWFRCTGSAISRTTHADLYAAIGTRYGAGDGVTTFNIPDLRGRFALAWGGGQNLGETGGAATHTLTVNEMPAHLHHLAADENVNVGPLVTADEQIAADYSPRQGFDEKYSFQGSAEDATLGRSESVGGGAAHNNMPPFMALGFIIKA